jgi:hypothetical protein
MKSIVLSIGTVSTEVPFATAEAGWKFTLQGVGGNQFDQQRQSATPTAQFDGVAGGQYVARGWREDSDGGVLGEIAEATFEFTEDPLTKVVDTAATISVQIV